MRPENPQVTKLRAHARAHEVTLSRQTAHSLLRRRGAEGARVRVEARAALIALASALGRTLTPLSAARRLDAAADDYDAAHARLLADIQNRRQTAFDRAWREAEQTHYSNDCARRHAAFLAEHAEHAGGSLGHRAQLLLLAAADAHLREPSAAARRLALWGLCEVELGRRHQVDERARTRAEVLAEVTEVIPADPIERAEWEQQSRRYREHIAPAAEAERRARELAEGHVRDDDGERNLALFLDALADHPPFRADVERHLQRIRDELAPALAAEHAGAWEPDPDAYRANVIEVAAEAARRATVGWAA